MRRRTSRSIWTATLFPYAMLCRFNDIAVEPVDLLHAVIDVGAVITLDLRVEKLLLAAIGGDRAGAVIDRKMPVARSLTQPTGECLGERRAVGDGFPLTARPPQFRGEPPPLFGIDITRFEQPGYLIDRQIGRHV